ncbi:MAG: LEA type 2 family protein [Phycisphaerales bacterium]
MKIARLLPRFVLSGVVAGFVWSASTGCSTINRPRAAVAAPVVVDQSSEATKLEFRVELSNPNDEATPVRRFEYRVSIDGREVFESKRSTAVTMPPRGSQTIVLPAIVPHSSVGGALNGERAYSIRGKLVYIAPGALAEALFDTGVRVPSASFSASGRADFSTP